MALTYDAQWQREDATTKAVSNIKRATSFRYTPTDADSGCRIRVAATARKTTGSKAGTTVFGPWLGPITARTAPSTPGGGSLPPVSFLPSVARVRDRIAAGSWQDEAEINAIGVQAYIEKQLTPGSWNDSTARRWPSYPTGFSDTDYPTNDDLGPQIVDVARMVGRRDGLRSIMFEFLINHLVPGYRIRNTARMASLASCKDYFYNNSLGNFEQLCKRFTMSVPLMYFMDGLLNVYGSPNENLGREILELFSLGIGEADEPAHYDQVTDVTALTNILTGHGVLTYKTADAGKLVDNDPRHKRGNVSVTPQNKDTVPYLVTNPDGTFTHNENVQTAWFYPNRHDPDIQTFSFLPGVQFSNAIDGPGREGFDMHPSLAKFFKLMASHRPAARFMCTKIGRWFLGRDPSPAVRELMMDKWIEKAAAPDQIAQVLRVLFFSEDFCTDYCTGRRALIPPCYYSKVLNYFGESYYSNRNIAIPKGYCEKEEYITHTYQTPAGFPDEVDYWLSPGHLTERGFRGQGLTTPAGNSGTAAFMVDYKSYLNSRSITTPRALVADVTHYWLCDRATPAQITVLTNIFGTDIDKTTDWSDEAIRLKVGSLFRTLTLVDLTHYAA